MSFINILLHFFSGNRIKRIYRSHRQAQKVQSQTLNFLINKSVGTVWAKDHGYTKRFSYEDFIKNTPINNYEEIFPYIEKMLNGESDVLWPGKVTHFAKSSGTTNDRSKYIPITKDFLQKCHFRGGKDMTLFYLSHYPQAKMVLGKTVGVGGSFDTNHPYLKENIIGDLSAILMRELPIWVKHRRAPRLEVATLSSWEEKLEVLARESMKEDIRGIAGVPSWTQLFIKKVIEISGNKSIYDTWPNFEVFFHGGVSLDPYRASFRTIFGENFHYLELYNASEGFFAIQDNPRRKGELLLMLDYNIFYEFILVHDLSKEYPRTYQIHEVELGKHYALVISTSGGLWRYVIGDVVVFTSLFPYRIKIVGRTSHHINIFGEELMVANTDQALEEICTKCDAILEEYSVAPKLFDGATQGLHEWVIEFSRPPKDVEKFRHLLDEKLRELNSDYDAKRKGDMLLHLLKIHIVKSGTFYSFMKFRNRLGGQSKVPRLSQSRKYIETILSL